MEYISYTTLQQKYPGKLVAVSQKDGKVVAIGKTAKEIERELQRKKIDPQTCVFLGPIEEYRQTSVY